MSKSTAAGVRSTRQLLVTYLSAQIDELRSREPGARIDSPDAVHRMRVASRRLRSSLATFRPLFRGSKAQRLRDELQWLGTVLGPVRDVEVMRGHLHETAAALVGGADLANVLAQLDHELAERHSRAHAELVTAMDGPRYAALLDALEAFVIKPPWATRTAKVAARLTLPALVGRACERVDRAARAARAGPVAHAAGNVDGAPGAGGVELHEVRKAAKRARYAAEVAGSSAGPAAHALAQRMEELQAVLGRHQDSLMVRALIQDLADRVTKRQALALDLLIGAEQADDGSFRAAYDQALAAASTDEARDWTRR